ncbi:hypothetical protein [Armatimonas rosea]|uniref:DNA repair exonuclease SbcCD ATPase subunit n=1 Tax=Armatimonas rosea TaxID=685828 RepID=A0A7W9SUX6_ARMRO|nr:hypothetical protein [Armatimonas rosea]MBB6053315.1 DNA repair exonuclease SbcCD ATPase subunit [Armatimonas rosea]
MPTTKPIRVVDSSRPAPPAGTKTHKQGCPCPICKMQRKKAEQEVRAEEYALAIRTQKAEELAKVESLEAQVSRVQEALRTMEDSRNILQTQLRNTNEELKAAKEENDALNTEAGINHRKLIDQRAQIDELLAHVTSAEKELTAMQSELASITGSREQQFREWDEERNVLQAMLEHAEISRSGARLMIALVVSLALALGIVIGKVGR